MLFKGLKRRGLDGKKVTLDIIDGLPGLERVFKNEFRRGKGQPCQLHVIRNVLAKVPSKLIVTPGDQQWTTGKRQTTEFIRGFPVGLITLVPAAKKSF